MIASAPDKGPTHTKWGLGAARASLNSAPGYRPALDFAVSGDDHAAMPLFALPFPNIDPILISIGPFAVRWYALAYVGGILIAWWLARRIAASDSLWGGHSPIRPVDVDDVIVWCAIGIVLGGRLGYVLFYQPGYFVSNPAEIFVLWRGGMSFHGGFLGTVLALILFARRRGIPVLSMLDIAAVVVPVGLFLGRIANFINGELWGRPADVPWAVIFPHAGPEPRHPSQLYEAGLEGILLFVILIIAVKRGALTRPGLVGGLFVAGYGLTRVIGEFFREPDAHIGYLTGGLTMGMLLSLPMILIGGATILYSLRRRAAA
jgi:phosphatidylglycerol:prolipoprotein diacylglycerol transferase